MQINKNLIMSFDNYLHYIETLWPATLSYALLHKCGMCMHAAPSAVAKKTTTKENS